VTGPAAHRRQLAARDQPVTAWSLATAISPRPTVRVAAVDDTGRALNRYPDTTPAAGPEPARPYAIHLTDTRHRYKLLGFDLDTRHGPVAADLDRLRSLLTRAGLPHLVCASGPGGGRHVWVALAEPCSAPVVGGVARRLAAMLPSLDTAPLLNPRTGALRPPGAPHRAGGTSTVIAGDLRDLLHPTAGTAQVLALAALVDQHPPTANAAVAAVMPIGTDEHGHPHLIGDRRRLPARAHTALTSPLAADADASAVLASVLCGAVRARWRLSDITEHLATAPGLEHVRTERTGTLRVVRDTRDQQRILAYNWRRCLAFVAGRSASGDTADDPTWEPRCAVVVAAVAAAQRRADASPGRWAQAGGPADRRVLDVLCDQVLAAVRLDIELDIRRLSHLTGIGRDTARVALLRLADDHWISRTQAADGPHAAHWALEKPGADPSTPSMTTRRSQADTRPAGPAQLRAAWRSHLHQRTTTTAHDVFTPGGLGHHAGRVYQALSSTPSSWRDVVDAVGYPPDRALAYLEVLARHRLAHVDGAGRWRRGGRGGRHRVATTLGSTGTLAARRERHDLERAAWAWWLEELHWRRASAAQKRRTPGAGQTALPFPGLAHRGNHRGAHPTRGDGRADYTAAVNQLRLDNLAS